jgi:hypothetical protein
VIAVFSGWRPHLGQQAFLSSRAPVRVLACGRRWGKTEVIAAEIALTMLAGTARQVLLVAPSQEQAMLGFERALEFLHRAGARPTVRRTPAPTLALGEARLWARSAARAEQLVNASPYVRMESYTNRRTKVHKKQQLMTPSFRFPLRAGGTDGLGSPREAGGTYGGGQL